jgi:glycopeptide antibiotics resistance protein
MQFNLLLFVPFGFLFSSLAAKKLLRRFFAVISASAFLEIAQYILAVGRSDITDILLNALGGVIGIAAYYMLTKLFGKHSRKAALIACASIAVFEIYVSVSFILSGAVQLGFMMLKM